NDAGQIVGYYSNASGNHGFFATPVVTPPIFQGLGFLPGGNTSYAFGVSADGNVVVGSSNTNTSSGIHQAYYWTPSAGMVSLSYPPGTDFTDALGVNGDGSVIVGGLEPSVIVGGLNDQAFLWTASNGMVSIGGSYTGPFYANGVSSDGTVVVGQNGSQ